MRIGGFVSGLVVVVVAILVGCWFTSSSPSPASSSASSTTVVAFLIYIVRLIPVLCLLALAGYAAQTGLSHGRPVAAQKTPDSPAPEPPESQPNTSADQSSASASSSSSSSSGRLAGSKDVLPVVVTRRDSSSAPTRGRAASKPSSLRVTAPQPSPSPVEDDDDGGGGAAAAASAAADDDDDDDRPAGVEAKADEEPTPPNMPPRLRFADKPGVFVFNTLLSMGFDPTVAENAVFAVSSRKLDETVEMAVSLTSSTAPTPASSVPSNPDSTDSPSQPTVCTDPAPPPPPPPSGTTDTVGRRNRTRRRKKKTKSGSSVSSPLPSPSKRRPVSVVSTTAEPSGSSSSGGAVRGGEPDVSPAGAPSAKRSTKSRDRSRSRVVGFSGVSARMFRRELAGGGGVPSSGGWALGLSDDVLHDVDLGTVDQFESRRETELSARLQALTKRERRHATGETRQFSYKRGVDNPLFGRLSEASRRNVFEGEFGRLASLMETNLAQVDDLASLRQRRGEVGCRCRDISRQVRKLRPKQLRHELHVRGLSTSGSKPEMQDRLLAATKDEQLCELVDITPRGLATAGAGSGSGGGGGGGGGGAGGTGSHDPIPTHCPCSHAGIQCHPQVCRCGSSSRCGNPFGLHHYDKAAVKEFRTTTIIKVSTPTHGPISPPADGPGSNGSPPLFILDS